MKIAIVAHYSRDRWVHKLVGKLMMQGFSAAEDIVLARDDGTIGAKANHLRAWKYLERITPGVDWGVVLEDDVTPCVDFAANLKSFLRHSQTPVNSLYLGRGRPPQYQERIASVISHDVSYITADALFSAQGYAMPINYFSSKVAEQVADNDLPIDEAITAWVQSWHGKVTYPKYSLIDHRDGPTLIEDHGDGQARNGNTSLVVDGCDPSGSTLPEIRKAWLLAGHNTAWNLGSIPLPEGAHQP